MNKERQVSAPRIRQGGFSLIELLVGVVLAMIAVVIVMQLFQYNERRQRTSTGGDTAIMDGAIAITDLQRDMRQSGMGMANLTLLGCGLTLPTGGGVTVPFGPVTINSGLVAPGDANTDTLLIMYGNGNGAPDGDRIQSQPLPTNYNVNTPTAFVQNDYVFAAQDPQPSSCTLLLDRVASVSGIYSGNTVTTNTGSAAGASALFDWGQAPRVVAYRVSGGHLTQCDFMSADCRTTNDGVWTEVLDGVVSLRAQYGRDTSAPIDGAVDRYDQTTPTTACLWARTTAVRVAITVRNGQIEGTGATTADNVTSAAPTWSGSVATANSVASPIVLSGTATWKRYRYRVFETVVPLRNVAWITSIPNITQSCP